MSKLWLELRFFHPTGKKVAFFQGVLKVFFVLGVEKNCPEGRLGSFSNAAVVLFLGAFQGVELTCDWFKTLRKGTSYDPVYL